MSSEGLTSPLPPFGPGRMVLVVGPSGAGKDTLLEAARAEFARRADIIFARRVVTRPGSASEDHDSLSPDNFARARDRGAFCLSWRAHDLDYGIPIAYARDLARGRCVVANGSRAVVAEARQLFRQLTCILVTAPPDVLAQRLAARERRDDITARLSRAVSTASPEADYTIENTGTPTDGARRLVEIIERVRADAAAPFPLWGP